MLIQADKITFGYTDKPLFNKVSFSVNEGDRIGLVGDNGAGKSTLFKCLLGIEKPYEGQIVISRNVDKIAYIPQSLPTDLEPVVFPFGGFKPYVFSSCSERGTALMLDGSSRPLELLTSNGRRRFDSGLAFGSHLEGELLFDIAPNVFHDITLFVGFHPDAHFGTAKIRFINDGKVIHEATIDDTAAEILVEKPSGQFGISFNSDSSAGTLVVATDVHN